MRDGVSLGLDHEVAAVARHTARRSRLIAAIAGCAAVTCLALAPAVNAAGHPSGTIHAARASAPTAVLDKSTLLLSAAIGNDFYVHMWLAPSSTGGQCGFVTTDAVSSPSRPTAFQNGGCSAHGAFNTLNASDPLSVGLTISERLGSAKSWHPPFVDGAVYSKLNVASVELKWSGGSQHLTLRHGSFAGGSLTLYKPPYKDLPIEVVAFNGAGHEVAHQALSGASLELMSASAFAHWEKRGGH